MIVYVTVPAWDSRVERITGQGGRIEPDLTAEAWAAQVNPGLAGIWLQSFGCLAPNLQMQKIFEDQADIPEEALEQAVR